jgi:surfactin synthase thioesterase subunit
MSPWWYLPGRRRNASARLFCFPHAGGAASVFRSWSAGLPEQIEVFAAQLPGRANRLREPPLPSIPAIVEALLPELLPHLDVPFAFFGHSMGAVVASEVARALVGNGGPLPRHLIVSSRRPPHMSDGWPPLECLSDQHFVEEIERRYGGIPAAIKEHPDVIALLLPCLRADIRVLEAFQPPRRNPVPFPISAFGGAQDRHTPRTHLDAWRDETVNAFRVRVFAGDHFYLEPNRAQVLADISATLAGLLHCPSDESQAASK